jgi:type III secretion protein I
MDITTITEELAPAPGLDDPAPGQSVADPQAAARFTELMEAPDAAGGVDEAAAVQPAAASTASRTLGDNILGGLQHLSSDLKQTWRRVGEALDGGSSLRAQDLLRMQVGLAEMSVQYELVSKAVSRTTQNIDQLVKLQ